MTEETRSLMELREDAQAKAMSVANAFSVREKYGRIQVEGYQREELEAFRAAQRRWFEYGKEEPNAL